MANELTLSTSLSYSKDSTGPEALAVSKQIDVTNKLYAKGRMTVTTSGEIALELGAVTGANLGYAQFVNRDATNFIEILTGTSGLAFAKLLPGESAVFRFGQSVTAPYATADTGDCDLEYLIIEE